MTKTALQLSCVCLGCLVLAACGGASTSKAQVAQAFGASGIQRKLDSVSIHGNQATVTFTETEKGQRSVETDALVREGGQWRADRVLKRSQSG